MKNIIDRIKTALFFDNRLIGVIVTLSIFMIIYYQINSKRQIFASREYTGKVTLINLEFEKFYSLDFYKTSRKLDKIVFDVDYEYQNKIYQNKAVLYWEYVTPKLERSLDERKLERLVVKCNKINPEQIMVYLGE